MNLFFANIGLILSLAITLLLISSFVFLVITKVPYVPSKKSIVEELFKQFQFPVKATFADVGSGDGRVVYYAEKHGLISSGYEISTLPYLLSLFWKLIYRSRSKIYCRNFQKQDLSQYQYIYCYLFPEIVDQVWQKIQKESPSGTYFICNTFALKSVQPLKVIKDHKQKPILYIYQK